MEYNPHDERIFANLAGLDEEQRKPLLEARDLAINGLLTDGAGHKQWYLEQIIGALGFDIAELAIYGIDWEEGIAP